MSKELRGLVAKFEPNKFELQWHEKWCAETKGTKPLRYDAKVAFHRAIFQAGVEAALAEKPAVGKFIEATTVTEFLDSQKRCTCHMSNPLYWCRLHHEPSASTSAEKPAERPADDTFWREVDLLVSGEERRCPKDPTHEMSWRGMHCQVCETFVGNSPSPKELAIALQTERTLHNAWEKRAYQAERERAERPQLSAEHDGLLGKVLGIIHNRFNEREPHIGAWDEQRIVVAEVIQALLTGESEKVPPVCSCADSSNEHGCDIHGPFYHSPATPAASGAPLKGFCTACGKVHEPTLKACLEASGFAPASPPVPQATNGAIIPCEWLSYARGGMGWCACGNFGSEKKMVPYAAWEAHNQPPKSPTALLEGIQRREESAEDTVRRDVKKEVGNVLDNWQQLPNDLRGDPGFERLDKALKKLYEALANSPVSGEAANK